MADNGYTQHEKVNQKISRSELLAWTTVIAVLIAGLSQFMS